MAGAWRYGATAFFTLAVVAAGILHGKHVSRWGEKPSLEPYCQRIDAIPKSFDDWTSEDQPMTEDLRAHGIEKCLWRRYLNRHSTESYTVLVVCGRPGPIAAHTPDVCYRGSGFVQLGEQKKADVAIGDDGPAKGRSFPLSLLRFRPPASRADATELEIRWAYMPPNKWLMTADNPRIEFAAQPALYKVYIVCERPPTSPAQPAMPAASIGKSLSAPEPANAAPARDATKFLQSFLPRLEAALKDPPQS